MKMILKIAFAIINMSLVLQVNAEEIIIPFSHLKSRISEYYTGLPVVPGGIDIKGIKTGASFRQFIHNMELTPDLGENKYDKNQLRRLQDLKRKDYVHVEKLIVESGESVKYNNTDFSSIPDDDSLTIRGKLILFNSKSEFKSFFLNGKMVALRIGDIKNGEYDQSETHIMVDELSKKFGLKPKIIKWQSDEIYNQCLKNKTPECDVTYEFIAGFSDPNGSQLLIKGVVLNFNGGIFHKIERLTLEDKKWDAYSKSVASYNKNKVQDQKQNEINKRNSDL